MGGARIHLRTLAVPRCTPVLRTGLGLVQGTRALHAELAPGNPGCSQRWEHRVSDVCAPHPLLFDAGS
eukprot:3470639-Pyramimonas_sp.AAC.1